MVDILLAAFNGEKYIAQQIDSILNQTYKDWKLYISDDCSSDRTVEIVKLYTTKYSNKIFLFQNERNSGSAKNNFFKMLIYSSSKYLMFCDQDDVWMPTKIKLSLEKMIECEKLYGEELPILVHSDLKVVDENLNVISSSMFRLQSLDFNKSKFNNFFVQNIVTGCTIMANQHLLKLVKHRIPNCSIMHDWWFGLIGSAFGQVVFINEPTVLYRQHSKNTVGSKNLKNPSYIIDNANGSKIRASIKLTYNQVSCFFKIYGQDLNKEQKFIISTYLSIPDLKKITRIIYLHKYKLLKSSFIRKIGQIIFI